MKSSRLQLLQTGVKVTIQSLKGVRAEGMGEVAEGRCSEVVLSCPFGTPLVALGARAGVWSFVTL